MVVVDEVLVRFYDRVGFLESVNSVLVAHEHRKLFRSALGNIDLSVLAVWIGHLRPRVPAKSITRAVVLGHEGRVLVAVLRHLHPTVGSNGCDGLLVCLVCVNVLDVISILLILVVEEAGIVILLVQILLGWFVLRWCSFLILWFCLLSNLKGLLGASKLLEDVLVVEDRVCKLILERRTFQEARDALADLGHAEDLVDRGALCRIQLQHRLNKLGRLT